MKSSWLRIVVVVVSVALLLIVGACAAPGKSVERAEHPRMCEPLAEPPSSVARAPRVSSAGEAPVCNAASNPVNPAPKTSGCEPLGDQPYSVGEYAISAVISANSALAPTQTFVADGAMLTELQLLVARATSPASPLQVEIRSVDLGRRYARGSIPVEVANTVGWHAVEWGAPAQLERGRTYAIVLLAAAGDEPWTLGAGPDYVYPFGGLFVRAKASVDLAFRASYCDGARTESQLSAAGPTPDERSFYRQGIPDGLRAHPYDDWRNAYVTRYFPTCIGERCADFSSRMLPDEEERQSVALASFRRCGELDDGSVSFSMEKLAVGITCRDVCAAHGFETCMMQYDPSRMCGGSPQYGRPESCNQILSKYATTNTMKECVCRKERIDFAKELPDDQKESMVAANFEVTSGHVRPRRAATPHGIRCADVCYFAAEERCAAPGCDRMITPSQTSCPRCGADPNRSPAFRRAYVAEDYLFVRRSGRYYSIDPRSGAVSKVDIAYRRQEPSVTGRFIHWHQKRREETEVFAVNVASGSRIDKTIKTTGSCDVLAHGDELFVGCIPRRGKGATLFSLTGRASIATPEAEQALASLISWDGTTLTAKSGTSVLTWKRGADRWESTEEQRLPVGPSPAAAEKLREIWEADPTTPVFLDGVYYRISSNGLWAFDAKSETFTTWDFPAYGGVTEPLIRTRQHVFDPAAGQVKQLSFTVLNWVGEYALTADCPDGVGSTKLEAPFDNVCSVKVAPGSVPHDRVVEGRVREFPPNDAPLCHGVRRTALLLPRSARGPGDTDRTNGRVLGRRVVRRQRPRCAKADLHRQRAFIRIAGVPGASGCPGRADRRRTLDGPSAVVRSWAHRCSGKRADVARR